MSKAWYFGAVRPHQIPSSRTPWHLELTDLIGDGSLSLLVFWLTVLYVEPSYTIFGVTLQTTIWQNLFNLAVTLALYLLVASTRGISP